MFQIYLEVTNESSLQQSNCNKTIKNYVMMMITLNIYYLICVYLFDTFLEYISRYNNSISNSCGFENSMDNSMDFPLEF